MPKDYNADELLQRMVSALEELDYNVAVESETGDVCGPR